MGKPIILFSKSNYEGQEILLVNFSHNSNLHGYLKKFDGIEWSKSLKSFYLPFSRPTTNALFQYLRKENYYIDYSSLTAKDSSNHNIGKDKKVHVGNQIAESVKHSIDLLKKWMEQKRYSENTIRTYEGMLLIFFRFHFPKTETEITEKDILKFNIDYILANRYSYTYQNQAINAIKLFYRQQGKMHLLPENLERPKKSKKLPAILSLEEIKSILENTTNLKHKTLLSLLYSCGLRIGEALKLKTKDIDCERKFMHVKSAKGSKDRYVPVSRQMIGLLNKYIISYKPKDYVFEGQNGGKYSAVSARQILQRSIRLSGIEKSITLHTLRHSHATHLLENGTDIRYIQELLGHNNPKTTMIYTHVSTASLDKIKNPFDDFEI
ncbi:tyrosine-type recombinase/integrase [Allomuricauda sp. F6463D]|uniref:tyrosine-type recombinase/integrase n=1 Tax=Allomuricauda sp. F6463D TaxID=2926409 RepID=UPI001FF2BE05|nr:tyrosine-type recombinase/integrase [Muricauda sp. F6463D]MCK0159024.1 site-specific integrase [Muricauda sp. F6463D]